MIKLLTMAVLAEGITHIEDLSNGEFIRTVETMREKIVTEKLDGANLWFGLDDTGLFTSREGKSPKRGRFYDVGDYPSGANNNGFRAAHLAVEKMESIIRKYLKEGDMVEMEVLYGRQPNTVTYGVEGKNFIVIIRGVNGTPEERVQNLSAAVNGKKVQVESTIVSSGDGDSLESNDEVMTWEFTSVAPLPAKKVDTAKTTKLLDSMKTFLKAKNVEFSDMTNGEVAELSLTSIPKDRREAAKAEREAVNQEILDNYKLPIKELLLTGLVRKIKPMLQDKNLHPAEDIGVEGVVVRDPVTGSMTKIVDKDVFTAINTFNSAVRSQIAGLVRTTDKEAPIESRGGSFGEAKIRIAELLGAKELAMSSGVKRYITKFKKSDPGATALELTKNLNITSVNALRTKIAAILGNSIQEVDGILGQFKKDADTYTLKLKTGKDIGLSPEVMKRTLTAFAETKKDIKDIQQSVLKSRTATDLIMALYGKTIESLFDGGSEMKESTYRPLIASFVNEDEGGGEATGTGSNPAAATTSGAIAPLEFKLFKNKIVKRRKRNWSKPKKFPMPDYAAKARAGSFSLIKSVSEDFNTSQSMQFAKDVDDSAAGQSDVEFKQLRNNVNVGNNVTQMDVNRYLNKAHDVNDEVDTVTFGLEMDDGSIVKVYVATADSDEFEKMMSTMLGRYDDIEEVINLAGDKFDIVDVEWPEEMKVHDAPDDNEGADASIEDESPEIDMEVDASYDEPEGQESSDEIDTEVDGEESEVADEPEGEESDEEEEDGEEEEEEEEERDEFGQPLKDKKKKKEKTEEALQQVGRLILEMHALSEDGDNFTNPAIESVKDLLISLGIDVNANRSFIFQAKRLASRNAPQTVLARSGPVLQKLKMAVDQLNKQIAASTRIKPEDKAQIAAATTQEKFTLLGSLLAESDDRWLIADLKSLGFQVSTRGIMIKMDSDEAEKLHIAIDQGKPVSVVGEGGKRFMFKPLDGGAYEVSEKGKSTKTKIMTAEYVDILSNELAGK